MRFGRTVRWHLTLWYMLVLSLSLLVFGFVVDRLVKQNLYSQVDHELADTLSAVTTALDRTFKEEQNPSRELLLDELTELGLPSQLALQLSTGGLKLLVNVRSLPASVSGAISAPGFSSGAPATIHDGPDSWRVCVAMSDRGAGFQAVLVRNLSLVDAQIATLRRTLLIAIPLILLGALAGGYFLAGRALQPVSRIAAQARHIEAQALSQRLEIGDSGDEFGRLAQVLNDLFARLERAFQQQRQFLSDAAHELRTPAAILRSQADVVLEKPRSAAEYEDALAAMRDETVHLSSIVDDLLLIARAEASQLPVVKEQADLMEIADECCRALRPLIQAKGLRLNWTIGEGVEVLGDPRLLRRATMNLLANAIKFTPGQGAISVVVERNGKSAFVKVGDTGRGIAPADLPHVFERFYRSGTVSGTEQEGAGLGLSIVKMIAELHGGEISVASAPGAGTEFSLTIPASDGL